MWGGSLAFLQRPPSNKPGARGVARARRRAKAWARAVTVPIHRLRVGVDEADPRAMPEEMARGKAGALLLAQRVHLVAETIRLAHATSTTLKCAARVLSASSVRAASVSIVMFRTMSSTRCNPPTRPKSPSGEEKQGGARGRSESKSGKGKRLFARCCFQFLREGRCKTEQTQGKGKCPFPHLNEEEHAKGKQRLRDAS